MSNNCEISKSKKILKKNNDDIDELNDNKSKVIKKKNIKKNNDDIDELNDNKSKVIKKKDIKENIMINNDESDNDNNNDKQKINKSDKILNNESINDKQKGKSKKVNNDENNESITDKKSNKSKSKTNDNNIDLTYLRLPNNEVIFENNELDNSQEKTSEITKCIDKAHNILYNAENIEGEEALNDIMNFLFLKLIENMLSEKDEPNKIDLLNKKHYGDLYDDDQLDKIFGHFKNIKSLIDVSDDVLRIQQKNNDNDKDKKAKNDTIKKMGDILITHPFTRMIYTENNFIKSRKSSTIKELLKEVICKIDVEYFEENEDVIGEIYEHMINKYVKKGSKLGQFFTPRKLMKLILKFKEESINNLIKSSKKNVKVYDSCMGTAGWLVSFYNEFLSECKNIELSGGEVKPTTFQYGLMNLLLTMKKFPKEVQCESSLTHINKSKYDLILTNPPFKTDFAFKQIETNMKSDEYTNKLNKVTSDDVYKLKDNNPPIQFLELNLFKLEENGMCIIVLPYGELFFGSSYKTAREHFMKTCNITDIILAPGGIFTHTGIKTCVIIFEKSSKGSKNIMFSTINKGCSEITKITSLSIDDINKEPYKSWYVRDYLKDEYIEELVSKMTNFEWAEFGDVFELVKGQIQSSKVVEDEDGEGVLFISKGEINESSKKISGFKSELKDKKTNKITEIIRDINKDNITEGGIFIANAFNGNGKCQIRYTEEKCIHSDLMSRLNIKEEYKNKINLKYIYYYLKTLQEHIETIYEKGSCNKSLDQKNFNRMKIPIPSLDEQAKIINLQDCMLNQIKLLNQMKNDTEKILLAHLEMFIKTESRKNNTMIKNMGDICSIKIGGTPSRNEHKYWDDGTNLWVSISELNDNIITDTNEKITDLGVEKSNVKLINKDSILLSFKLSIGKLAIAGVDLYTNEAIAAINSLDKSIPNKYLYYCFKILNFKRFGRGVMSENGSLNSEQLKLLKIPILINNNYSTIIEDIKVYEDTINNYLDNIDKINQKLNNQLINYLKNITNNDIDIF
jgi:type I restriction-modification system DNA methylase subunit